MNIKEWRGLRAKRPVFVLLTPQETGEGEKLGRRRSAAPGRRPLGHGGGWKLGEIGRAALGTDSPLRFEGWRPAEAAPRRWVVVGSGARGGGATGLGGDQG